MEKEQESKGFKKEHKIVIGLLIVNILLSLFTLSGVYSSGSKAVAPSNQPSAQNQPEQPQILKDVSLADDPVMGNKDAKITLVEFSDYECPFCKRHFDQTLPQLKKDYVDTGKVKVVYRDFPLSFHNPMATTEAIAANCAREQGGDTAYFQFHDGMFTKTTSNGNGLNKDKLYQIARDNGLNEANFKTCLDSEKYKEEVQKDVADGEKYQVSGTPTFFIGNAKLGYIRLTGAQPFEAFKQILDQLK